MKWIKLKIGKVKINPKNPRIKKDSEFKELIESLKRFPKMLEIRPIVLNSEYMILGGDKRFKACKEIGMKEIPVVFADDLTEDEQKEFIIKDNVSAGDWDTALLKDNWGAEDLKQWGVDIEENEKLKAQAVTNPEIEITQEILEEHNYLVFTFKNQLDWQVVKEFFNVVTVAKAGFTETYQQKGIGRVKDGKALLNLIKKLDNV